MDVYGVTVINEQGQLTLLRFETTSSEQAIQLATRTNATVLGCEVLRRTPGYLAWLPTSLSTGAKRDLDIVIFSQDLATLLDAGVTVKDAIGTMNRKQREGNRQGVLDQLENAISNGAAFSQALRKTGVFPETLVATVAASEQTGDLATGLSRYAKHQQSLRLVRDKVIGACIYPLLLLAVGSLVVALLLGVVVPRFATLIDSGGKQLPLLSRILMSWGHFVDSNPLVPYVLLVLVLVMGLFITKQVRDPVTRKKWIGLLPGVGKVAREFQHLQLYRTTAILTARGISIHKALVYGMEFLNVTDQSKLQVSLNAMREGSGVSEALSQAELCDPVALSMLQVAEKTGSMPEMLDRIADFHERSLQRSIDIVSRLIEPILMIVFGILIGGIVILMYLPIFDLASSLS